MVEPADDLNLIPRGLINVLHQSADEGVGVQQVRRHQQLGDAADPVEQERHRLVQPMALGQQQQSVQLLVLAAIQFQFYDHVLVQTRQDNIGGVFQDLGPRASIGMGQHPVAVIQVAV